MASLFTHFSAVVVLSAAAGSMATLAVSHFVEGEEHRDSDELPGFEERFVRELGLREKERALVRTILHDYRDRRREIEGQAAASARAELSRAGREADWRLRGILSPEKRQLYDDWLAKGGSKLSGS